jgi:serpin B
VNRGPPTGLQLAVANASWGQKGYRFLKEFLDLTRTHYGAALRELDLVSATEAACKTINAWAEEQTQGKIKDLVKPEIVDASTRLILTNAI